MENGKKSSPAKGIVGLLKKKKTLPLLAAGLLLGVLLLCFGGGGEKTATPEKEESAAAPYSAELTAYAETTKAELTALCESVAGVSDVEVMLSFSRGYRVVYVTDGSKNPVTVGSGSSKQALPESVLPPEISGVGIVCRGGARPEVQEKLTELVSTALGISAGRVYVTGK